MGRNLVETLMGAVVLVVAGLFLAFAYSVTNVRTSGGYELTARFDRIDGLVVGADVRISGIRVGSVTDARLDPQDFAAVVRLTVIPSVRLPVDSTASVSNDGLLGGSFLALVPGGDDHMIEPGGRIQYTQAPVNIVQLLGRIIFSAADNPNAGRDTPPELGGGRQQGQPQPGQPQAPGGGAAPAPEVPRPPPATPR
jgi:phospholipid/cholesterol/gamma-HCH transport system substrate-binding protein